MTQKRFIISFDNNQNIYDREEKCYYSSIDALKLCDLLNDLEQEARDNEHYHSEVLRLYKAVSEEKEQLKQQLTDCKEKKQQMKEFFMNSEAIIEQKKLQKLIYQTVINLIDNKIDEFKNGDYGDLPCNTIHMFLDLKQEIDDDLND